MRCKICSRADAKAINMELLSRQGRRSGAVVALAERLGVCRQTLWRHRKEHLQVYVSPRPVKEGGLSFEERARLLSQEAHRLLVQGENGLERSVMEQGLKAIAMRVRLLELEAKFASRPLTQKREEVSLEDPEEGKLAEKEFLEVVGGEK